MEVIIKITFIKIVVIIIFINFESSCQIIDFIINFKQININFKLSIIIDNFLPQIFYFLKFYEKMLF